MKIDEITVGYLTTTNPKTTSTVTSTTTTGFSTTSIQTADGPTKAASLIPLQELQKDIILLSLVGVLIFGVLVMICIMTRNRKRQQNMAMEFQNLTATSSTTVFDKRQ